MLGLYFELHPAGLLQTSHVRVEVLLEYIFKLIKGIVEIALVYFILRVFVNQFLSYVPRQPFSSPWLNRHRAV